MFVGRSMKSRTTPSLRGQYDSRTLAVPLPLPRTRYYVLLPRVPRPRPPPQPPPPLATTVPVGAATLRPPFAAPPNPNPVSKKGPIAAVQVPQKRAQCSRDDRPDCSPATRVQQRPTTERRSAKLTKRSEAARPTEFSKCLSVKRVHKERFKGFNPHTNNIL